MNYPFAGKGGPRQYALPGRGQYEGGADDDPTRSIKGDDRVQTWLSQVQKCAAGTAEQDKWAGEGANDTNFPWRPHNLPLPHGHIGGQPPVQRREHDFCRDTILHSPPLPSQDDSGWRNPSEDVQSGHASPSSGCSQSGESSLFVSETPDLNAYKKRPRRKTRDDRYERRKRSKHHQQRDKAKPRAKDKQQKVRRDQLRSGKEVMDSFASDSLGKTNVIFKPNLSSSFFGNGKTSEPSKMADLEFNDLAFITQDSPIQPVQASQVKSKKQKDQRAVDLEEESNFFKDARKAEKKRPRTSSMPVQQSGEVTTMPLAAQEPKDQPLEVDQGEELPKGSHSLRPEDGPTTCRPKPPNHGRDNARSPADSSMHERRSASSSVIPESVHEMLVESVFFDFLRGEDHEITERGTKLPETKDAVELPRNYGRESTGQSFDTMKNSRSERPQHELHRVSGLTPHQMYREPAATLNQNHLPRSRTCLGRIPNQDANLWATSKPQRDYRATVEDEPDHFSNNDRSVANDFPEHLQTDISRTLSAPTVHRPLLTSAARTPLHNSTVDYERSHTEEHGRSNNSTIGSGPGDFIWVRREHVPQDQFLTPDHHMGTSNHATGRSIDVSQPRHYERKDVYRKNHTDKTEDLLAFMERAEREILGADLEQQYYDEGRFGGELRAHPMTYKQGQARVVDASIVGNPNPSRSRRARILEEEEKEMRAFWRPNRFIP